MPRAGRLSQIKWTRPKKRETFNSKHYLMKGGERKGNEKRWEENRGEERRAKERMEEERNGEERGGKKRRGKKKRGEKKERKERKWEERFKAVLKLNRATLALGKDTHYTHTRARTHSLGSLRCSLIFCTQLWSQTGPGRSAGRHTRTCTHTHRYTHMHTHTLSCHITISKCHTRLRSTKAALICMRTIARAHTHAHSFTASVASATIRPRSLKASSPACPLVLQTFSLQGLYYNNLTWLHLSVYCIVSLKQLFHRKVTNVICLRLWNLGFLIRHLFFNVTLQPEWPKLPTRGH